jgi:hypothetical protein
MKYFIINDNNQLGPFSHEDLPIDKITKDTLVWYEGLADWSKASELEELNHLFVVKTSTPPPPPKPVEQTPPPPPQNNRETNGTNKEQKEVISYGKSNKKRLLILSSISFLVVAGLVLWYLNSNGVVNDEAENSNQFEQNDYSENQENSSNNDQNANQDAFESNNSSNQTYSPPPPREKSEYELQIELRDKEGSNPLDYLRVSYRLEYKVFTGEDKIIGTVHNSASMADFSDIGLAVSYFSKTGTLIDSENFILYEIVNSRSEKNFTLKVKSPPGTKTIGVKIRKANHLTPG